MVRDSEIIRYEGTNDTLFSKITVDRKLGKKACIVIPDTHNAILVKDGKMMDTLESGVYPIYDKKLHMFSDSKGVLLLDIIFMSKTAKLKMLWGTKTQICLRDPITELPLRMGINGELEVQVGNPRKFYLELVGLDKNFSLESLRDRLLGKLMNELEPVLSSMIREKELSYDRIGEFKKEIGRFIEPTIAKLFLDDYGIKVYSFIVGNIMVSESDCQAIEAERVTMKAKLALKEKDEKSELLDDKKWEREKYMLELKETDYNRYLEVCKIIGWGEEKDTALQCLVCGTKYSKGAKFCGTCGASLEKTECICPNCQKVLPSGSKFCNNCGTKI